MSTAEIIAAAIRDASELEKDHFRKLWNDYLENVEEGNTLLILPEMIGRRLGDKLLQNIALNYRYAFPNYEHSNANVDLAIPLSFPYASLSTLKSMVIVSVMRSDFTEQGKIRSFFLTRGAIMMMKPKFLMRTTRKGLRMNPLWKCQRTNPLLKIPMQWT